MCKLFLYFLVYFLLIIAYLYIFVLDIQQKKDERQYFRKSSTCEH